jgi:large subunit ribosomal protein L22
MAKVAEKQNTPKLVTASARSLHISPRKMRLVTNLVKNLRVSDAVIQLGFTNKKGAKYLIRLLRSAAANAENNFSMNADNLYVKSITCDMGQTMKRYFPRARGSAFVIRHKLSHVNVVLEERAPKAGSAKSRFSLPKRAKKDEQVITKEGSAGTPVEAPETLTTETPVSEHHVTHPENTDTAVEEKKTPENQLK